MQSLDYQRAIALEQMTRKQRIMADLAAREARKRALENPPDDTGESGVREPRRTPPGASPASVELVQQAS